MQNRDSHYSTDALFRGFRTLLTSLPSEEEKSELIRTLTEAQDFLGALRLLIEAIPTMESSQELSEGLSRLDILANRGRSDAGLRRLLGLKNPVPPGSRRALFREDVEARAHKLEQELAKMETPDLVVSLEQSREPLAVLIELANRLRIRARSKERRADLTKRIATHIANQRGYSLLRGDT